MTVLTLQHMNALEPLDFCRKYSKYTPEQWGYKGQWNRLIARVLEISVKTVEGWGEDFKECPERYKHQLDMVDALITAKETLERLGIDPKQIESEK